MDNENNVQYKTKFCKHCGEKIPEDAVICTKCGRQVEEIKKSAGEQIVINNTSNSVSNASATVVAGRVGTAKNKWISLILCFFLGWMGAHKFYEGKIGMGIIYLFTFGLFCIGPFVDFIVLLFKPETYYV